MTRLVCQINHYRSSIDGTEQPYAILGHSPGENPAACVVLLHPSLNDIGKEAFIEYAFGEMARWRPAIERSDRTAVVVIPRGRGNASWMGPAGNDLWSVLEDVARFHPLDSDAIYLAGEGSGATGALQLACWHPDRWAALAVAGPIVDERKISGALLGGKWEESVRSSVRPAGFIANLGSLPIRAEHPWWHDGTEGTAHPDQSFELEKLAHRHRLAVEFIRARPLAPGEKRWPADPEDCFRWLFKHRRLKTPNRNFLLAASRSCLENIAVDRFREFGKPARLRIQTEGTSLKLQTTGASQLSIKTLGVESISIDSRRASPVATESNGHASEWTTWDRVGDAWSLRESDSPSAVRSIIKSRGLSGPMMDMRWSGIVFVHGSLGDDFENETMKRIARDIRDAWITGMDSPAIHPGRRDAAIEYDLLVDDAVTEEILEQRHLVIVGTPRTHLLLARWRGQLGCQWSTPIEEDGLIEPFRLGARLFEHPRDGLFLLGLNPEATDRYLLVITGTTIEALAYAPRHPTAFMPDYAVFNGPDILQTGYCGSDWKP